MRTGIAILLCGGILVCIMFLCLHNPTSEPTATSMVQVFFSTNIAQRLADAGFKGATISKCSRTTDANGMLISGHIAGQPEVVCWIVKDGIINCVKSDGPITYADEGGRLVAWYKQNTIEDSEILETNVNFLGLTPNLTLSLKLW